MKKIVLLFAVVLLAAPALAVDDVYFRTYQEGPDGSGHFRIYVYYDATGASSTISGLSFDVECDSGATILSIADYKTDGYSTADNPGPGINIESMTWKSDPNDGVEDWGDPMADDRDSLPWETDPTGMTICTAVLFDPCTIVPNPALPEPCDLLFSFEVDKLCVVKFTPDTETRGGIVMADGSVANTPIYYHVVVWHLSTQCNGDTNGDVNVDVIDWPAFKLGFGKSYPDPAYNPSADFNRDGTIDVSDWPAFKLNFGKAAASNCYWGMYSEVWPPPII